MPKFRKKPVVIDAVRWINWNSAEVADFMDCSPLFGNDANGNYVMIETSEGTMRASDGDWIIRGIKGELYPCKNEVFQATYEPVDG